MYGWHGKLLRVNLSNLSWKIESIDPGILKDYLGGRGLAVRYLSNEMDPTVDPLSPDNILIMANGPLTGTPTPTGNRYMVVTKSPLTGALSNSNAGGFFPTEMKRTGFDMFIFEGRAEKPVYLWVNNDQIEIRSAEHLWGKLVPDTDDTILAETDPKARVACIGPAGENLVRVSSIMNDKHRAAGRSGVGAVMGSKNLKAVAVRGTIEPELFEPVEMKKFCGDMSKRVGDVYKAGAAMRVYGTSYVPPITNELGILPTRNFQSGVFDGIEGLMPEVMRLKYLVRNKPCYRCPIGCGRVTRIDEGKYQGEGEGPEYETIAALGSDCGISNMAALTIANYHCNELGLDTISTGMTIACAMEMYEKGFIPESDIGMPLNFGDADAVIDLVQKTAYREGFGEKISEGSYRLASSYGHPEFSITAKKQEFPGYDPRGSKGMGLLYATSNKGASHMAGDMAYVEVFGTPEKIDSLTIEGKPELVMRFEDSFALIDSAGLCVFLSVRNMFGPSAKLWPTNMRIILNHATGSEYTEESLLKTGERIFNLERMFLLRAGFTKADDTLPKRMLEEPLPAGGAKGHVVELDQMLPLFYQARGWDENGVPTPAKLHELGID